MKGLKPGGEGSKVLGIMESALHTESVSFKMKTNRFLTFRIRDGRYAVSE